MISKLWGVTVKLKEIPKKKTKKTKKKTKNKTKQKGIIKESERKLAKHRPLLGL